MNKTLNLYPIDYPFESLVDRASKGKLILDPEFQRKYKWDKDGTEERCSKFIESCLMRIPLPACYFAEDKDGNHLVIDGVQRITTIKRYLNDEFALQGLTVYSELNGKKFSELGKEKSVLESTTIRCVVLRNENPEGIVQEIFARLNQGAVTLSAQEIRHAIYPGSLDKLLCELAELPEVRNFKHGKSKNPKSRDAREDEELVLRFFSLDGNLEGYEENLSKFFDYYMMKHQNLDDAKVNELRCKFQRGLRNSIEVFGEDVFRNLSNDRSRQSTAMWDLQMISLCHLPEAIVLEKKTEIYHAFKELCDNKEFSKGLAGRLVYRASILDRRNMWQKKLDSVLSA